MNMGWHEHGCCTGCSTNVLEAGGVAPCCVGLHSGWPVRSVSVCCRFIVMTTCYVVVRVATLKRKSFLGIYHW